MSNRSRPKPHNRAPRVTPVRQLVTVDEFASYAAVSVATVRRWIRADLLPSYRTASTGRKIGMIRLDLRDLDRVITRDVAR